MKILFENADLNNISYNMHFLTLKFLMQKNTAISYLNILQNNGHCTVKQECGLEQYVAMDLSKSTMAQFRCRVLPFSIAAGRYRGERICIFCDMRKSREWNLFYFNKRSEF